MTITLCKACKVFGSPCNAVFMDHDLIKRLNGVLLCSVGHIFICMVQGVES